MCGNLLLVEHVSPDGRNDSLKWQAAIWNTGSRTYGRVATWIRPPSASWATQIYTALLPITVPADSGFELDTWLWGNGTLDQSGILVMTDSTNKLRELIPATQQSHEIGHQVGNDIWQGWAGGEDPAPGVAGKFLTFGPYESLAASDGTSVAVFKLLTSSRATTSSRPPST
jgi:hypothetical protein